jgi:2-polyprenyl-6-methoxyphenol hydroxylase-like FAD-dependent oxidoreductase
LAEEFFAQVGDFDQLIFSTYTHVWMPRWHDSHMLFLGDAAHAMSPHLGQGINLALLDAWCFADCLGRAPDHRSAFRAYSRTRRAHVRFYAFVTALLSPFFQSRGIIKGIGRDIALPLMTRLPFLRPRMLLTMAGLRSALFGGRLTL